MYLLFNQESFSNIFPVVHGQIVHERPFGVLGVVEAKVLPNHFSVLLQLNQPVTYRLETFNVSLSVRKWPLLCTFTTVTTTDY